jgi:hypothetical protein
LGTSAVEKGMLRSRIDILFSHHLSTSNERNLSFRGNVQTVTVSPSESCWGVAEEVHIRGFFRLLSHLSTSGIQNNYSWVSLSSFEQGTCRVQATSLLNFLRLIAEYQSGLRGIGETTRSTIKVEELPHDHGGCSTFVLMCNALDFWSRIAYCFIIVNVFKSMYMCFLWTHVSNVKLWTVFSIDHDTFVIVWLASTCCGFKFKKQWAGVSLDVSLRLKVLVFLF